MMGNANSAQERAIKGLEAIAGGGFRGTKSISLMLVFCDVLILEETGFSLVRQGLRRRAVRSASPGFRKFHHGLTQLDEFDSIGS
jgi:hypothetical protein